VLNILNMLGITHHKLDDSWSDLVITSLGTVISIFFFKYAYLIIAENLGFSLPPNAEENWLAWLGYACLAGLVLLIYSLIKNLIGY